MAETYKDRTGMLFLLDAIAVLISTFGCVIALSYAFQGGLDSNLLILSCFFTGIKILILGIGDFSGLTKKFWAAVIGVVIADALIFVIQYLMVFGLSSKLLLITLIADAVFVALSHLLWKKIFGYSVDRSKKAKKGIKDKDKDWLKESSETIDAADLNDIYSSLNNQTYEDQEAFIETIADETKSSTDDLFADEDDVVPVAMPDALPNEIPVANGDITPETVEDLDYILLTLEPQETTEDQQEALLFEEAVVDQATEKELAEIMLDEAADTDHEDEMIDDAETIPADTETTENEVSDADFLSETVEDTVLDDESEAEELIEEDVQNDGTTADDIESDQQVLTDLNDQAQMYKDGTTADDIESDQQVLKDFNDQAQMYKDGAAADDIESDQQVLTDLNDQTQVFKNDIETLSSDLDMVDDVEITSALVREKMDQIIEKQNIVDGVLNDLMRLSNELNDKFTMLETKEQALLQLQKDIEEREEAFAQQGHQVNTANGLQAETQTPSFISGDEIMMNGDDYDIIADPEDLALIQAFLKAKKD